MGDNLVGTIEAAFDKFSAGSAAGTILINGEYDGFDFGAVTNTNLISIKASKNPFTRLVRMHSCILFGVLSK